MARRPAVTARRAVMAAAIAVPLLFSCSHAADEAELFGRTKPEDYLTGRFNPVTHERFVCVNDAGVPTNEWRHYLRRETVTALAKMYADFRKAHPKAPFWVQSSTRSFNDQKAIWDGKWNGQRYAREKDPMHKALAILRYSSMPGTSRHHWGTDFDLNILTNEYYESGGGKVLYRWMTENAGRYGFCQPYTAGRKGGYNEEKWHWSYRPLAAALLGQWNNYFGRSVAAFSRTGLFSGSEIAGKLAPVFVNTISESCR
ncbi:MAG: M15 family metallopeptidase [Spirochaetes bacterium]|nr:M15 family metallopeptidase [Spirochaetota bacterium]